ncbi:MAG: hypothetical protein GAK28_04221 [Luteibacter sp.]|uniref:helix-turn-helix domain-containing protein n=1 Tax=Luteibacter sp. TaxID=1886636 RepID=UPI00137F1FBB|nr:helix-turn-helix domain-containing protein [Luteibacter sp.]KAF1004057.1 MAG: hypothetical protein GAK28_04221 [Luteibacter sp.]
MSEARGKRLRTAMYRRGIRKHAAIAAAVGVNESTISRWTHGGPMTVDNVVAVCGILDVSADWLLLGRGEMESHRYTVQPAVALPHAVTDLLPPTLEQLAAALRTLRD